MRRPLRAVPLAAMLAASLAASPLAAQQGQQPPAAAPASGLSAELVRDVQGLERKYVALAEAMVGKYAWRPGQGVRSVSEVLMHIASANYMIPTMFGVQPPPSVRAGSMDEMMATMRAMEKETDPAKVRQALTESFAHARQAIAAVPDDQLDAMTKLFGRDATKRAALLLFVNHMHEHLGQSIAYARANGVTPPWSQGGDGEE